MMELESQKKFESYLRELDESKQAEAAAQAEVEERPDRSPMFTMAGVICVGVVGFLTTYAVLNWVPQEHDAAESKTFWDSLLGGVADATGREYDEDAVSLTDQLTLRPKD